MCLRLLTDIYSHKIQIRKIFYILFSLSVCLVFSDALYAKVDSETLGLVVNMNDQESILISDYYRRARQIPEKNIFRVKFPAGSDDLQVIDFERIKKQLDAIITDDIQVLALAWRKPWKVDCMSITSAFSLGFDVSYCATGCKTTRKIKYFNSDSRSPFMDYAIRPSMLLSGSSIKSVKAMIDNGVRSDYSYPKGTAYLLNTNDRHRNGRSVYYDSIVQAFSNNVNTKIVSSNFIKNKNDIMFYFTGIKDVEEVVTNKFLPGSIADHLTSFGGDLFQTEQMSILKWIDAGVTGTYGTVTEPCNFRQKFPNPGIVMQKYIKGEALIEAYWKSVSMPGQGLFVGEPLASPFKIKNSQLN